LQAIAPGVPKWMLNSIKDKGMLAHHFYFKEAPWEFQCPKGETAKNVNY